MVELVDTLVSGTSARKGVQVRVLFRVQKSLKSSLEIQIRILYLRPEKNAQVVKLVDILL